MLIPRLQTHARLPSSFEPWTPIGHAMPEEWPYIPQIFLPLNTIAVGVDASTGSGDGASTPILLPAPPTPRPGGVMSANEALQTLVDAVNGAGIGTGVIRLQRTGCYGVAGNQPFSVPSPSPRFGFQVHDWLKHKGYIGIAGAGMILGGQWASFDVIPSLEYVTNSRLKPLYVKQGLIKNVIIIEDEKKTLISIYDDVSSYPDFQPEGKINIWIQSDKNQATVQNEGEAIQSYDKKSFDIDGYEDGMIVINSVQEDLQAGNFFQLSNPWIVNDPTLLFEYGLAISDDGLLSTHNQQTSYDDRFKPLRIRAVWIEQMVVLDGDIVQADSEDVNPQDDNQSGEQRNGEEQVSLWCLYTDEPIDYFRLPRTPDEQKEKGESSKIWGSLDDGISLLQLQLTETLDSTIRVGFGSTTNNTHNFASGCLRGEFICYDNKNGDQDIFFQIVNHPRVDALEIRTTSINSSVNFLEILDKEFSIFQQKFWFITELFHEVGRGLWEGDYTIADNNVVLKDVRNIPATEILDHDDRGGDVIDDGEKMWEQGDIGAHYLTSRFLVDVNLGDELCKFYHKGYDWYFCDIETNKTFEVLGIQVEFNEGDNANTLEPFQLSLSVMVADDDLDRLGTRGYVFLGDPFLTYSGWHGEMSLAMDSNVGLSNKQWYLDILGFYYAGTYKLPDAQTIANAKFFLTDMPWTPLPPESYVYASTEIAKIMPLSTFLHRYGNITQEKVVYLEKHGFLSIRASTMHGTYEISRRVCFLGLPTQDGVEDGGSAGVEEEQRFVIEVVYELDGDGGLYCFLNPTDVSQYRHVEDIGPYEATYIHAGHYINNRIARNLEWTILSQGAYFPLGFRAIESGHDKNGGNDSQVKSRVSIDTLVPIQDIDNGDVVTINDVMFEPIENGLPFAAQTRSVGANRRSMSYVEHRALLENIRSVFAFALPSSETILFYCKDAKTSTSNDNGTTNEFEEPSVFVAKSSDDSGCFYNPHVLTNDSESNVTAKHLMILYDFDLRCVTHNTDMSEFYLFGYAYEHAYPPAVQDRDRRGVVRGHKMLVMYSVGTNNLFQEGHLLPVGDYVARFPILRSTEELTEEDGDDDNDDSDNDVIGRFIYPYELEDDGVDEDDEKGFSSQIMVSILEVVDGKLSFQPHALHAIVDGKGVLYLWAYIDHILMPNNDNTGDNDNVDVYGSGVVGLVSHDKGLSWYYSGFYNNAISEQYPFQLGNILFLVDVELHAMLMVNLSDGAKKIVAFDVASQPISAIRHGNGVIMVYFYHNVTSHVSSVLSRDDGDTWELADNW